MIVDHISRLESWLFWRDLIDKNPSSFGNYRFPQPLSVYNQELGPNCRHCGTNGQGTVHGKNIYCICSMLAWLEQSRRDIQDFETPVRATSLNTLHPLGLDPKSDELLSDLLERIKNWIQRPDCWLVIQGPNGCGKTHILASIKTSLNGLAAFISIDRFQQKLFSAIEDSGKVQKLISDLSIVPVLLLDDWGLEHESSWTTDTLASIINRRYMYASEFLTVITFNTPMEKLITAQNPARKRIISRLIDSDISEPYFLTQADYRSNATKERIKFEQSKRGRP